MLLEDCWGVIKGLLWELLGRLTLIFYIFININPKLNPNINPNINPNVLSCTCWMSITQFSSSCVLLRCLISELYFFTSQTSPPSPLGGAAIPVLGGSAAQFLGSWISIEEAITKFLLSHRHHHHRKKITTTYCRKHSD